MTIIAKYANDLNKKPIDNVIKDGKDECSYRPYYTLQRPQNVLIAIPGYSDFLDLKTGIVFSLPAINFAFVGVLFSVLISVTNISGSRSWCCAWLSSVGFTNGQTEC